MRLLVIAETLTKLFSANGGYNEEPVNADLLQTLKDMNRFVSAALCKSIYRNQTFECGNRCSNNTLLKAVEKDGAGYITVGKDLVVAFRGSQSAQDYVHDFNFKMVPWRVGKVHQGFLTVYRSLRDDLFDTVVKAVQGHPKDIRITGHSLGGALGILFGLELSLLGIRSNIYTFGQPRVGDREFVDWASKLPVTIYRVIADGDIVPTLPPKWFGYEDLKSENYIIRNGETFHCLGECMNKVKYNFDIHANGYYWNTTLIDC